MGGTEGRLDKEGAMEVSEEAADPGKRGRFRGRGFIQVKRDSSILAVFQRSAKQLLLC